MSASEQIVRDVLGEMVAAKTKVDAEWAEGKRDGCRSGLYGVADAVEKMVAALDADNPIAFKAAAEEARKAAYLAQIHGHNWFKRAFTHQAGGQT